MSTEGRSIASDTHRQAPQAGVPSARPCRDVLLENPLDRRGLLSPAERIWRPLCCQGSWSAFSAIGERCADWSSASRTCGRFAVGLRPILDSAAPAVAWSAMRRTPKVNARRFGAVSFGPRLIVGPGVACPKSWRAGCEPAALETEPFPDCPPGPPRLLWRRRAWLGRACR